MGYVMRMEEKGEVFGKQDFSEGSENEEEQELLEPPEALERDFVSTGESSWPEVRVGAAAPMLSRASSPGPLHRSLCQFQPLHRVGPRDHPWPGCQSACGPNLAQPCCSGE